MRPVWISLLLPGAGQWKQKRYNAGTFYLAAFLMLFSLVAALVASLLRSGVTWPTGPFASLIFLYGANVIDVIRGRDQLRKASAK